jgi:hypothetical protein
LNDARLGGVKNGGKNNNPWLKRGGHGGFRGDRGVGVMKNKSSRGFKPDAKVVRRNEMEIKTNVCIRLVF